MIRLQIRKMTKETDALSNTLYFDATVEFYNDEVLYQQRRYAFPIEFKESDIQREIAKIRDGEEHDQALAVEQKKFDELNSKADEVIANLVGKKI